MSTATNIDSSKSAQANTYDESSASNATDPRKQPDSQTVEQEPEKASTGMASKVLQDRKEGESQTERFANPGKQKPVGEL